ncbi:uncharacterized protein LOC133832247 [Humulus lupulus]|uniref:uncharacterized protein LOC133832247 n=1 Tax=Humulus lupulus TaxID=3486 RepID=UPI002B40415C|nr:uncharacterized protein LOC133832247 [Humulus lupulus]
MGSYLMIAWDIRINSEIVRFYVGFRSVFLAYVVLLRVRGSIGSLVDLEEIEVEANPGANPPFAVFEGFINRIWGKLGIERIARMNASYTLVKFRDEATRDLVLEAGVVHFDRKLVILRPWSTDLDAMRLVKYVPVWVRLPGLGLKYWGVKCLSALASTIDNPILVDKVTKDRSMVQFARVLVDGEITEDVPKSIQFLNQRGQLMEQMLESEWLPTQCKRCKVLGHAEAFCNRKQGEVWRKKDRKSGTQNTEEVPIPKSTDLHSISVTTGTTSELISKDTQKVIAKEMSDPHSISFPTGTDSVLVSKDTQKAVVKERCDTRDGHDSDWLTPKRVGGVKILAPTSQNQLKNSYTSEGRILLVWHTDIVIVEVLQENDQFIHAYVKDLGSGKEFCLSFVYGRNTIEERFQLLQDLTGLTFPVKPWLVAGDLNSAFDFDDRLVGCAITVMEMADAQRWRSLGLVDELRTSGSHFTWTNKQAAEARIYSKLDRIFKNEAWTDLFPHFEDYVNWDVLSNHCFCIIKSITALNSGIKPFRFFNMWADHDGFREIVLQS